MLVYSQFKKHSSFWLIGFMLLCLGIATTASADKLGGHLIYMEPNGADAEDYSDGAFGFGIHGVAALPKPFHMLGLSIGLENVELRMQQKDIQDPVTLLTVRHFIRQRYTRFYLGGELGGHGRGFLRPHIGFNFAIINYGYSITVRIPESLNPFDPGNEISQKPIDEQEWALGQDFTLGLDILVHSKAYVDVGVRYLKSYSVPQPLKYAPVTVDDEPVKVHPEYFQIYIGGGFNI